MAPVPGSAEYLASLLNGEDGNSCDHKDKTKREGLSIPKRLGFFRRTDDVLTYIDTDNICQDCYDKAVPDGYGVWSTYYKKAEQRRQNARDYNQVMMDSDEWSSFYGSDATQTSKAIEARRKLVEDSGWAALRPRYSDDYFPPMIRARKDGSFEDEEGNDLEVRREPIPSNAEAHEAFRLMKEAGMPFYIDILHLSKPWNANAPDRQAEDRRVAGENWEAYKGASRAYIGTGVGGAGPNSIVEQRILGDRATNLGDRATNLLSEVPEDDENEDFVENQDGEYEDPNGNQDDERHFYSSINGKELPINELPLNFPYNHRDEIYPYNHEMPPESQIDEEELQMTGGITGPTPAENERRYVLEKKEGMPRVYGDPSHASVDVERELKGNDQKLENQETSSDDDEVNTQESDDEIYNEDEEVGSDYNAVYESNNNSESEGDDDDNDNDEEDGEEGEVSANYDYGDDDEMVQAERDEVEVEVEGSDGDEEEDDDDNEREEGEEDEEDEEDEEYEEYEEYEEHGEDEEDEGNKGDEGDEGSDNIDREDRGNGWDAGFDDTGEEDDEYGEDGGDVGDKGDEGLDDMDD